MAFERKSRRQLDLAATVAVSLPPRRTHSLSYRPRSALPMDPAQVPPGKTLLLDSAVYIDGVKSRRLPPGIHSMVRRHPIEHAKTCIGALSFGYGCLDPRRPGTPDNLALIAGMLATIQEGAIVDASPAAWAKAGALHLLLQIGGPADVLLYDLD